LSVLETERLRLRRLTPEDTAFVLRLLNEPSFIQNIGDKGVRTPDDARTYIADGPAASYRKFGFGLWLVELKETGAPVGICGLLKRDALEDPDLGYALLPEHWSRGYAFEAASAVVARAGEEFGLRRLAAITDPDNLSSIRVLERLGFEYLKTVRLSEDAPEVKLFARDT